MANTGGHPDAQRWDTRYSRPEYLFGTEPNAFLVEQASRIPPRSRVLCVADGEGRNGSWLAASGHAVTAFDASLVATRKAEALDRRRGVEVDRHVALADAWPWQPDAVDVVAAIFIQFAPPALRADIFAGIRRTLRPGGLLLLQGYTPRQLEFGTGGPPEAAHMYTRQLLQETFGDWQVELLREHERLIDEGPGHNGMSAVIDLVAVRGGG